MIIFILFRFLITYYGTDREEDPDREEQPNLRECDPTPIVSPTYRAYSVHRLTFLPNLVPRLTLFILLSMKLFCIGADLTIPCENVGGKQFVIVIFCKALKL